MNLSLIKIKWFLCRKTAIIGRPLKVCPDMQYALRHIQVPNMLESSIMVTCVQYQLAFKSFQFVSLVFLDEHFLMSQNHFGRFETPGEKFCKDLATCLTEMLGFGLMMFNYVNR